jgi:hypothetical protein
MLSLLEAMRERATDSLRVLSLNNAMAPGELRFGPVCDSLLAIRNLMLVYGDSMTKESHEHQRVDVHKIFANQLPLLLTSLESVAENSSRVLNGQARG